MSRLRLAYAAMALWGAIHPMAWFIAYMRDTGTGLAGLVAAWHANASTTGLTWDLTIAAAALTVWIVAETRVRHNWTALVAIPVHVRHRPRLRPPALSVPAHPPRHLISSVPT